MKVVCPGSFDPVTNGHLDVVARAARLFDQVVVAVVHNPSKHGFLPVADRLDLLRECLPADLLDAGRVEVDEVPGGLLVDYCARVGAVAVVKGVRGATDIDYEQPMAQMNRHLSGLETVYLPGDPSWLHVSSSLVREVARLGGEVSALVPAPVLARLDAAFGSP